MANRKVVAELSKLWDSVASKGKLTAESRVNELRTWVSENPTLTAFQSTLSDKYDQVNKLQKDIISKQISAEDVAKRTRHKVGSLMRAYEELIGISEVKSAHERVLSSEAKFILCQENRRLASKELSEIHNKLMEIRAELDRTQRGDDSYLDLIKEEIEATKQERKMRKHFEDLERTEREVFSELSSALRFSHEKERAQNEKTKYWGVVGSVVGATLGVLGSTINNRMKQSHIKHVLEETSAQVAAIQTTVENLSNKLHEGSLAAADATNIIETAKSQDAQAALQQEKFIKALQESIHLLQELIVKIPSYSNEKLPKVETSQTLAIPYEKEIRKQIYENRWHVAAIACCSLLSYVVYKFT